MNNFLNTLNLFVDKIALRSVDNIVSQFKRTQLRLAALNARAINKAAEYDKQAQLYAAKKDEQYFESARACHIIDNIIRLVT